MGVYTDHVVPRIINVACGMKAANELRERICSGLKGHVVEIGFGSGLNVPYYPPAVSAVAAIEPSDVGWSLGSKRLANATVPIKRSGLDGQRLPFDDDTFDAVMATVTVHQWRDTTVGLTELRRVSRGPVVVLTFDGDELDRFWLADYAPELIAAERRRYPAIATVAAAIGRLTEVREVPIPIDCVDGFTEAYYARPEAFLDPHVRAAQSAWGFITPEATKRAVDRLRSDLTSGRWQQTYGHLLTQPQFTGSLRLLVGRP